MLFFKSKKKKTCVLGLDGVPFTLLQRFVADGTMPNAARIFSQGRLQQMKVTLPEISAVSWPSFMTGANPGTHGIFGFTDLKPGSYAVRYPNYRDVKAMVLWDKLENKRKRSIVLNQPGTYPAQPMNGVLVSGFVAIDLRKAVTPLKYKSDLEKMGYRIDINTAACRDDHALCIKELNETLAARKKAVEFFLQAEEWDYLQVVITGTDRLHHYLWDALDNTEHPYHAAFLDFYRQVDAFIGWLYQKFQGESGRDDAADGFFMLSDHGFTGIRQEVYLTRWLHNEGYLKFDVEQPESLEQMSAESRAFVMDPGRIMIHRSDRFPNGCVAAQDVEPLKQEMTAKLLALECSGEKVIQAVHRAEDIYSGPYVSEGPDLVVVGHDGYDLKAGLRCPEVFTRTSLTGMHTWDDAFFWSRAGTSDNLCITDLSSIILNSF